MRFVLALSLLISIVPTLLWADQPAHTVKAKVEGQERYLDADELVGFPEYDVEFKAWAGDKLVSDASLSTIKGFPGTCDSIRGRGYPQSDGTYVAKELVDTYLLVENPNLRGGMSREEYDRQAGATSLISQEHYLPVLQHAKKFTFDGLDCYIYSRTADHFELKIYRNDFPGYVLDQSQPGVPVANLAAPQQKVLVGTYSGALQPNVEEVLLDPATSPNTTVLGGTAGNQYGTSQPAK